jgi:uncharacterized protein YndB with AHSA1/START domain
MRILKRIVVALLLLIVGAAAIGLLLPSHFKVERSVGISAPPEKVYALLEAPHEWKKWTVWNQRDPNMQLTYSGPEKGQGAGWAWQSKSEGSGSMEFTRAEPAKLIEYRLSFPEFNMSSAGKLELTATGNNTKVTWTNEGDLGMNPVSRYFGLAMDSMVGGDFEAGLKNLKALAEK